MQKAQGPGECKLPKPNSAGTLRSESEMERKPEVPASPRDEALFHCAGLHSRLPRGVRPRLEGKPRTPLSSRVATRVSWSPLSGLKGKELCLREALAVCTPPAPEPSAKRPGS